VPLIPRLASLIVGLGVFLGLAILGWGGWDAFFADTARTTLAFVTLALFIAGFFAGGSLSPGIREDRANRWVLPVFFVLGLLAAYVSPLTDRLDLWTIDGDTVRWIGIALYGGGGALRLWPVVVLGHRFSGLVAIQPEHTLQTGGIYQIIRHPSYLGLLISSFGWGLAFRSLAGVLLAALLIPPIVARIYAEERLLSSQFGAEYEAYRSRTTRLLPWW
jgi:protein-S-isoprenylcysteine O-methyltransferase Ste14